MSHLVQLALIYLIFLMKHSRHTFWQSQILCLWLILVAIISAHAQVNSGSNGSDGPFNPTGNVTINMADHPDGIYHYTSVNIPSGVTVTFTPNANNTPVVWLVQGDCVIGGSIEISGGNGGSNSGAQGGPGGFSGGNGGSTPTAGRGPGGAPPSAGIPAVTYAGNASFATLGQRIVNDVQGNSQALPGSLYGNQFCLPLVGGSGGGGQNTGGSGGGGAILIASSLKVTVNGQINAKGGSRTNGQYDVSSGGSGGAVRIVAPRITGGGQINSEGGSGVGGWWSSTWVGGYSINFAGNGRIRFDSPGLEFGGTVTGAFTQGFQPIIIPASGQGVQLGIQSIGGVSVAGSPNGVLANPDVILPAQQTNPMNVVVNCSNLPMNTTITVTVRPANGADIVVTGTNSSGTPTASTATIPVTMPRGGGIIFAKCVSGVAGSASVSGDDYGKNIAQTGWTAHGERFAQMEITAGIGSSQQVAYITESGKRYTLPAQ